MSLICFTTLDVAASDIDSEVSVLFSFTIPLVLILDDGSFSIGIIPGFKSLISCLCCLFAASIIPYPFKLLGVFLKLEKSK